MSCELVRNSKLKSDAAVQSLFTFYNISDIYRAVPFPASILGLKQAMAGMPQTIDSGAVSRIVGVGVNTLNMWIVRELIPRMPATGHGNAREYDINDVLYISVMVALIRLGYGASFGAMCAAEARDHGFDQPGARLIISPPRRGAYGLNQTPSITHVVAESGEELDAALDKFVDGRPESFVTVELDRLSQRVRHAFRDPELAERARRQRGMPPRRSVRRSKSK
jgi:hypothetical protein